MAEEYVLVSKSKYEQLMPNGPPPAPSQVVSVTRPPMGLPAGDALASSGETVSKAEAKERLLQATGGHDNGAYISDSDSDVSEDDTKVAKGHRDGWSSAWKSL